MNRSTSPVLLRRSWALLMPALLAACASPAIDPALNQANQTAGEFTGGKLALNRTDEQRRQSQSRAEVLLGAPLTQEAAVELALVNSPAVQATLAEHWAERAHAVQSGRLPNPVFAFERIRAGAELELGRLLSFGLLDILTLPQRHAAARQRLLAGQTALSAAAVDAVTRVRQAWVRAIAAEQSLVYARQVLDSAEASAELAKRMQVVGNFNRLSRMRQQAFYADAAAQVVSAQHEAVAAREALVRALGLTDTQAARMTLPSRLPELPAQPRAPAEVAQVAARARLDVQIAQAQLSAAARAQGLTRVTSLLDVELGLRRDTVIDRADGDRSAPRGWEVEVRLPLFDAGDAQRAAFNAQTLAAAARLEQVSREAGSQLREGYSAYRAAYDLARHYREEVVPLRQAISEENLLRYNGMLIGVFELLADSREQIGTVRAALRAQEQFWLADAALRASLIGRPMVQGVTVMAAPAAGAEAPH
jgi:outer membrane protein TolC